MRVRWRERDDENGQRGIREEQEKMSKAEKMNGR